MEFDTAMFHIFWVRAMITAQKMKLSIKDFFSKCDQIRSFLQWMLEDPWPTNNKLTPSQTYLKKPPKPTYVYGLASGQTSLQPNKKIGYHAV